MTSLREKLSYALRDLPASERVAPQMAAIATDSLVGSFLNAPPSLPAEFACVPATPDLGPALPSSLASVAPASATATTVDRPAFPVSGVLIVGVVLACVCVTLVLWLIVPRCDRRDDVDEEGEEDASRRRERAKPARRARELVVPEDDDEEEVQVARRPAAPAPPRRAVAREEDMEDDDRHARIEEVDADDSEEDVPPLAPDDAHDDPLFQALPGESA